jgi:hypothetical protein
MNIVGFLNGYTFKSNMDKEATVYHTGTTLTTLGHNPVLENVQSLINDFPKTFKKKYKEIKKKYAEEP